MRASTSLAYLGFDCAHKVRTDEGSDLSSTCYVATRVKLQVSCKTNQIAVLLISA